MAIAISGSPIEATVTTGNITLASWTPGSNELVLVFVMTRTKTLSPSVSGNGLTFVQVAQTSTALSDGRTTIFRAMGSSPSTGAITITLTGNVDVASAIAVRLSGVDTGGTNGSAACEASNTNTPASADTNFQVSVTTLTANAWVMGLGAHSNDTYTLQANENAVGTTNLTAGSGGGRLQSSVVYKTTTSTGSVTLGANGSLGSTGTWAAAAVAIKPSTGTTFTQSNSGTLTSSGALIRKAKKVTAGTLTTAGAIIRKAKKVVAGTLTTAGAVRRKGQKVLAGTLTTSGAVTAFRKFFRTLTGTLTSSGAIIRKPKKVLAGTLTTGGALAKKTFKTLAGTLTSAGGLTSQILQIYYQVVGGTLTTAGTLTRKAKKSIGGTLTTAGTLIRKAKKTLGGTLTSSGAMSGGIAVAAVALTVAARAVLSLPNRLQTWALAVRNTFTVREK